MVPKKSTLRGKSMRKFVIILLFVVCSFTFVGNVHAQTIGSNSVSASAKVGAFSLSVQGIIAPYASVILLVNDTVLRSVVADENGVFSISDVALNAGVTTFCLQAIDVRRLGESYTCFNLPVADQNTVMNNLFLPPTVGLVASEINTGDTAIVWGYSMPGAQVTLFLGGKPYVTTADSNGFYQLSIKMTTAGTFELFADASYSGRESAKPTRTKTLTVLALPQVVIKTGVTWLEQLLTWLKGIPLGLLWLAIPIFILIIILLYKLKPEWFGWWDNFWVWVHHRLLFFSHKLHHAWFVGY